MVFGNDTNTSVIIILFAKGYLPVLLRITPVLFSYITVVIYSVNDPNDVVFLWLLIVTAMSKDSQGVAGVWHVVLRLIRPNATELIRWISRWGEQKSRDA